MKRLPHKVPQYARGQQVMARPRPLAPPRLSPQVMSYNAYEDPMMYHDPYAPMAHVPVYEQQVFDPDLIADQVVAEMYGRGGHGLDDQVLLPPMEGGFARHLPAGPSYGALEPVEPEKTRGEVFVDNAVQGAGLGLGIFGVFFALGAFFRGLGR